MLIKLLVGPAASGKSTYIKHLIKDDFNGEMFSKLSRLYFKVFNKELTLWIESQTISEEDIELLKNSYKHRFELIRFDKKDQL